VAKGPSFKKSATNGQSGVVSEIHVTNLSTSRSNGSATTVVFSAFWVGSEWPAPCLSET